MRRARVMRALEEQDPALLKLDSPPLPPLAPGDSDRVRDGQGDFFTGFPVGGALGLIQVTHQALIGAVTPIVLPAGIANYRDARVSRPAPAGGFDIFEPDAVAYPGKGGRPLYDSATGEVIGIVNLTVARSTQESALPQPTGIAYAIPVRHLRDLLERAKP